MKCYCIQIIFILFDRQRSWHPFSWSSRVLLRTNKMWRSSLVGLLWSKARCWGCSGRRGGSGSRRRGGSRCRDRSGGRRHGGDAEQFLDAPRSMGCLECELIRASIGFDSASTSSVIQCMYQTNHCESLPHQHAHPKQQNGQKGVLP